eukprot:6491443-Amphidinium_carterae.5
MEKQVFWGHQERKNAQSPPFLPSGHSRDTRVGTLLDTPGHSRPGSGQFRDSPGTVPGHSGKWHPSQRDIM